MKNWSLLLPFPVLAVIIGLAYCFGSPNRTMSSSFSTAKSIAPLESWGLLFLFGGFFLTVAMLLRDLRMMSFGLFIGGMIYTWWGTLFLISAMTDLNASLTGWAIYGFLAFVHYAGFWRLRMLVAAGGKR